MVPVEPRSDVNAQSLWNLGTTTMFDLLIFHLNADSYLRMTPEKDLTNPENNKRVKLQVCLGRSHYYTPKVYTESIIPREDSLSAQRRLVALLRFNLKRECSEMCGFVQAILLLAIVRSSSLILRIPW